MTVIVFGSINVDVNVRSRVLPRPGETVHGESYAIGLGGKGANQAVAAAKLGAKTRFVGRVGADAFGGFAIEALERFGVPTADIAVDPGAMTGIATIGVDAEGRNSITVVGGANMSFTEADGDAVGRSLGAGDVLLLQLEIPVPAILAAAAAGRARGARIVLDPAPAPGAGVAASLVAAADILTPNELETAALVGLEPTDEASAAEAGKRLIALGAKVAIVKLGARGCMVVGEDESVFIPAFKVATIDTVAAGDCFNGGLAAALSFGAGLARAGRFAAATAALSTTKIGAADAAPSLAEVEALTETPRIPMHVGNR